MTKNKAQKDDSFVSHCKRHGIDYIERCPDCCIEKELQNRNCEKHGLLCIYCDKCKKELLEKLKTKAKSIFNNSRVGRIMSETEFNDLVEEALR